MATPATPATTAPPPPHAAAKYLRVRPYLMEVAGAMEDPAVASLAKKMHALRNRYFPIVRTMSTLAAAPVTEDELFGPGEEATRGGGWLRRPRWAVSGNKTRCIVPRLHPDQCHASGVGETCPMAAMTATAASSVRAAGISADTKAEAVFDDFVKYRFLAQAITHNHFPPPQRHEWDESAPLGTPANAAAPPAATSFTRADVDALVVRHYVNEACRTASFLVADGVTRVAALIDPSRCSLAEYEKDLAALDLRLTHIMVTHCFVDSSLCVRELRARHPTVQVLSGVEATDPASPSSPSAALHGGDVRVRSAGETVAVALSPRVTLRSVTVPSFSPEAQLIELGLCGTLVAIFSGAVWGTDAAPRADLYDSFDALLHPSASTAPLLLSDRSAPPTQVSSSKSITEADVSHSVRFSPSREAMAVAQRNLKTLFYDRYLFLTETPAEEVNAPVAPDSSTSVQARDWLDAGAQPGNAVYDRKGRYDRVVLFPSHGGYSNVSNQLDLYWAIALGDLKRMRHARVVVDTLATPDAYASYAKKLPPLPRPLLFQSNRRFNLLSLLSPAGSTARWEEEELAGQGTNENSGSVVREEGGRGSVHSPYAPLIVDARDAPEYHKLHLRGAVNVPFSYPGAAYGAKRAELWLQCLLLPTQPIIAVVASAAQKSETEARLRAVAPCAALVAAFTVPELLRLPSGACLRGGSPLGPQTADGDRFDMDQLRAALRSCQGHKSIDSAADKEKRMVPDGVQALPLTVFGDETSFTAPVPAQTSARAASLVHLLASHDGGQYHLCWVACTATDTQLARIDTPEKLSVLDVRGHSEGDSSETKKPRSASAPEEEAAARPATSACGTSAATLVVDVRTDYEFKQGSHQRSVHQQLAELCELTAGATRKRALASLRGPSPAQGQAATLAVDEGPIQSLYGALRETAIVSGVLPVGASWREVSRIAVYCAGGYRSLIAASLFRRALELAVDVHVGASDSESCGEREHASRAGQWAAADDSPSVNTASEGCPAEKTREDGVEGSLLRHLAAVPIVDVAGGAFTIMTHRPDLWMVKDRSIICIS